MKPDDETENLDNESEVKPAEISQFLTSIQNIETIRHSSYNIHFSFIYQTYRYWVRITSCLSEWPVMRVVRSSDVTWLRAEASNAVALSIRFRANSDAEGPVICHMCHYRVIVPCAESLAIWATITRRGSSPHRVVRAWIPPWNLHEKVNTNAELYTCSL